MCLRSKQSSLFSFYALPSGDKSKGAVVHFYLGSLLYIIPQVKLESDANNELTTWTTACV